MPQDEVVLSFEALDPEGNKGMVCLSYHGKPTAAQLISVLQRIPEEVSAAQNFMVSSFSGLQVPSGAIGNMNTIISIALALIDENVVEPEMYIISKHPGFLAPFMKIAETASQRKVKFVSCKDMDEVRTLIAAK